jgi:hypothetical protein
MESKIHIAHHTTEELEDGNEWNKIDLFKVIPEKIQETFSPNPHLWGQGVEGFYKDTKGYNETMGRKSLGRVESFPLEPVFLLFFKSHPGMGP